MLAQCSLNFADLTLFESFFRFNIVMFLLYLIDILICFLEFGLKNLDLLLEIVDLILLVLKLLDEILRFLY